MADHYPVTFEFGPLPAKDAEQIADASDLNEDVECHGAGPELTGGPDHWRLHGWCPWGLYGSAGEGTLLALLSHPITVTATMPPDHDATGEQRIYTPDGTGGHTLTTREVNASLEVVLTATTLKELAASHLDPAGFRAAVITAAGLTQGTP